MNVRRNSPGLVGRTPTLWPQFTVKGTFLESIPVDVFTWTVPMVAPTGTGGGD